MDEATVSNVDLWRFDEAFARVGMKGWQTPYQQEIDQQIDVSRDRGGGHLERCRQARCILHRGLIVGEHGPQAVERLGRNTRPELLYVAFQIRSNETLPQSEAVFVRRSEIAVQRRFSILAFLTSKFARTAGAALVREIQRGSLAPAAARVRMRLKTIIEGPDSTRDRIIRSIGNLAERSAASCIANIPPSEREEIAQDVVTAIHG